MLTIEVKLNGRVIATAKLVNQTNLAAISDYSVTWSENGNAELRLTSETGRTEIHEHRRAQSVWTLVAKAAAAIIGQKVDRMEGKE